MKLLFLQGMLLFLMCLIVSACASSTDRLISEAYRTGNWTAVNHRFDAEAKREQSNVTTCGDGQILICTTTLGDSDCACVSTIIAERKFREAFGWQSERGPNHPSNNNNRF